MANRAGGLTPEEFVQKWSKAQLSERAASHEHFIDLCHREVCAHGAKPVRVCFRLRPQKPALEVSFFVFLRSLVTRRQRRRKVRV